MLKWKRRFNFPGGVPYKILSLFCADVDLCFMFRLVTTAGEIGYQRHSEAVYTRMVFGLRFPFLRLPYTFFRWRSFRAMISKAWLKRCAFVRKAIGLSLQFDGTPAKLRSERYQSSGNS